MRKLLFIDRDGTLIAEPVDQQVDAIEKIRFIPGVFQALTNLQQAGYEFVMVTNQDGLGTSSFPQSQFEIPQQFMLEVFKSQGIEFSDIRICPHFASDGCACRKPRVGLVQDYLARQEINRQQSYVIGDRDSDLELARNMGIEGLRMGGSPSQNWASLCEYILTRPRCAVVSRKTCETQIEATVNLDAESPIKINTGIGFFDHMLEQLAKHGGFSLQLIATGDLHIDDHHTVEDTALVLGQALKKALGDKWGIARYGFTLPMDEALAQVAIDLSGRAVCQFNANFLREKVGDMATELVIHFFQSLASSLAAAIHIQVTGDNTHHMIEAIYKAVGRALRSAFLRCQESLPTTKGAL